MSNRVTLAAVAILMVGAIAWRFCLAPSPVPGDGNRLPIVQVVVPELSVDAKNGQGLFEAKCASCHGKNAAGQKDNAPPLIHKIYEPNHHGDISFYRAAKNGVRAHHWPFGDMPPVEDVSRDQVTKIIAYVRALQRANGIN